VGDVVATAIETAGLPAIVFSIEVSSYQAPTRRAPPQNDVESSVEVRLSVAAF